MKASYLFLCLAVWAVTPFVYGSDAVTPLNPSPLFDGNSLNGWLQVVRDGSAPKAGTWTVSDGLIRCSGEPAGYIRTVTKYCDYRLVLEWRWSGPELVTSPTVSRKRLRNSGVLVHVQLPDTVWPSSLEAQLMETNAGDIYVIGSATTSEFLETRAKAIAAAGSDEAARKQAQNNRRLARQKKSSEQPAGEWNRYEITCSGETLTLKVNGVQQNQATQLSYKEGFIALQSEGAPLEFRKIELFPLE